MKFSSYLIRECTGPRSKTSAPETISVPLLQDEIDTDDEEYDVSSADV